MRIPVVRPSHELQAFSPLSNLAKKPSPQLLKHDFPQLNHKSSL